jgi:integrase
MAGNTGQRGSDLVRMRWTDLEVVSGRPGINVTQQKTGVEVWIPFTNELQAIMTSWERRPGFILLNQDGMPWQRKLLSDAWRWERKKHESLRHLVLHGLRGTAVVRLRRAGCSIPEISAWVGMSEQMVRRYTRYSDQKENALAALVRLEDARAARKALK